MLQNLKDRKVKEMGERSMKQTIGILSLSGLLVLSGCSASAQEVFNEDSPVSVEVNDVQEQLIGTGKVYAGTVTPSEEVEITSKVSGKITEMPIEVGTKVKAGQVVVKIDDKDLRHSVEKANAAIAAAEANVESAKAAHEASMAQATTGIVQSKSGVVQSKSGMVQSKNGMVQSKSGMVQSKSGIIQAQNAMVQAEDNIAKAQSAVKQAENGVSDSGIALKKAEQTLKDAKTNHERMKGLYEESLVSKAQLEQAETAVVNAQAAYDSAKVAVDTVQDKLATAKKGLTAAGEAYANAKEAYMNAKSGYANASEGYNTATEGYSTAQEAYDTAQEGYANAQKQAEIAKNESGIKASEQALKQAQVNAEISQDTLEDAVITSPINGVVGAKYAEKGEMISTQSPVLVLANFDKVNILTYIPANEINEVKAGNQVQVKATSFDFVTKGTIKTVSPFNEKGKGYPVEVEVPNPDFKLKAGMIADIQLIKPGSEQGIIIPSKAVGHGGNKAYVYVAKGNHAKRREVKVEKREGSLVIVKEGLTKEDKIITSNLALLSDNATINYSQEDDK